MKIILVRHAEPDYSVDSLTEKGWREAGLLKSRIQGLKNVKYWYCSPLGRAKDTAMTALDGAGIEPVTLDWVKEFEGRVADPRDGHMRISWDFYPEDWTACPEMFDKDRWTEAALFKDSNVADCAETVIKGLDELLLFHGYRRNGALYDIVDSKDYTVVIFCHMAVSLLMIGHLTNIAPPLLWHGFFGAPSCFFEIQTEERINKKAYFRVRALGDLAHLYAAGEEASDSGFKLEKDWLNE